jgi:hypothetical protein
MEGPRDKSLEKSEKSKLKVVDRDVLEKRLIDINDESEYQRLIYPYLLEIAGLELPPIAIAGVISLSIEYATYQARHDYGSSLARYFVDMFVDAMLDEPSDRNSVKAIIKSSLGRLLDKT